MMSQTETNQSVESPGRFGITLDATAKRRIILTAGWSLTGATIGYILTQLFVSSDVDTASRLAFSQGIWFMLVLGGIGGGILGGMYWREGRRPDNNEMAVAAVAVLAAGFVAGYLAQSIYSSMLDTSSLQACFRDYRSSRNDAALNWCYANTVRAPRALGWLLAGAVGGLGIGAAFRSVRHGQNAVAGGAIGGLIGGLLFDSIPGLTGVSSLAVSQFIAVGLIAVLVAALISIIETARATFWIDVTSGEMAGHRFLLADHRLRVGSARTLEAPLLGDRSVREVHAEFIDSGGNVTVNAAANATILVNGAPAVTAQLTAGDVVTVGSTELRLGSRAGGPMSPVPSPVTSPVSTPSEPASRQRQRLSVGSDTQAPGRASPPSSAGGPASPPPPSTDVPRQPRAPSPGQPAPQADTGRVRPRLPLKDSDR
jgi:MFS family permease